jgi:hypothetical protein
MCSLGYLTASVSLVIAQSGRGIEGNMAKRRWRRESASNRGAIILGEIAGRLTDPRGRLLPLRAARPAQRSKLIERHGADAKLPELREDSG